MTDTTDETPIRRAEMPDHDGIVATVEAAYARYVPRIGRPAPMLADYRALIAAGDTWVIAAPALAGGAVPALLVLEAQADGLMIENVAVHPSRQGIGLGGRLLDFAEAEGRERGFAVLRLYTNAVMTENIALYGGRGFAIVERRTVRGFDRIYMAKRLR